MARRKLNTLLTEVLEVLNSDDVKVNLYLGHRKADDVVAIVNPTIQPTLKDQLLQITKTQIELCKKLTEADYNVVGSNDDTVERASVDNYKDDIAKITKSIEKPTVTFRFAPENFDFFIYSFTLKKGEKEKTIRAIRRTKNIKFLKKGFLGQFTEGVFKQTEDSKLIGTDDLIDLFIYDDDVVILNHSSFESIFKLTDSLKKKAESVLSNPAFDEYIDRIEVLKTDALQNRSYTKRLSRLDGKENSTLFLNDLSKTKSVIDQFELDIEVDVVGRKIRYRDNTQLSTFINLMQDSFYKTLIGEVTGIDERK